MKDFLVFVRNIVRLIDFNESLKFFFYFFYKKGREMKIVGEIVFEKSFEVAGWGQGEWGSGNKRERERREKKRKRHVWISGLRNQCTQTGITPETRGIIICNS